MLNRWLDRLRDRPAPIADEAWSDLLARSSLLAAQSPARLAILRNRTACFLHDKTFHAAAGHRLDESQKLVIAAMACLPVITLGYRAMRGWSDVIVYPGGFRSRREHHDETTGVVTLVDEEMVGEAWEHGPVVLSWADIAEDLDQPADGFNVVIHEIAHKLDMLDGAMNGVPCLPPAIPRQRWINVMQAAYDRFVVAVDGGDDVAIDPYAAESVEEFFAVLSEYHFSAAQVLAVQMPAVATLLDDYYGAGTSS